MTQTRDSANPFIIVMGILASIAVYVIPLVYMGCTRVAIAKLDNDKVTFKRVSATFSQAVMEMAKQPYSADRNQIR